MESKNENLPVENSVEADGASAGDVGVGAEEHGASEPVTNAGDVKNAHYKEMLLVIKSLPESIQVDAEQLQVYLDVLAEILDDKLHQDFVKSDAELANKLLSFLTKAVIAIVGDKMGAQGTDGADVAFELGDSSNAIQTAFGTATNFFAIDFGDVINFERYQELVDFLLQIWLQDQGGKWRAYGGLPFQPLINLTFRRERASYFVSNGTLNIQVLVERSTSLDPHSPEYVAILESLVNLSQVVDTRKVLMQGEEDDFAMVETLLARNHPKYPIAARVAITAILRNIAFESLWHDKLVSGEHDILSLSLRPIIGKGEYTEEEMIKMPNLVYALLINNDNRELERDPAPKVRRNVLEFLYMLCSQRSTRVSLRDQNIYMILREYHKWETEGSLQDLSGRVVNLLIQTEDEIGVENLLEQQTATMQNITFEGSADPAHRPKM